VLAVLAAQLCTAPRAVAQAPVPPQGQGTVSVTYQNYRHTGHFDVQGNENTNGPTRSQVLVANLDFGVTDAIGLNVTLPVIASKYVGTPSYIVDGTLTFPGPLDDGTYHTALQDLRIEMRRMFMWGPVFLAPFGSVSIPTHEYETQGEAVPGRHRTELQAGVSASADLSDWIPRTQAHARYAYATLERVNDMPHTRSNVDVDLGFGLTSRVLIHGGVGWQIAHQRPTRAQLLADWTHHDRFINSSFVNVGGGGTISINSTTDVYAVYVATVKGDHGAHVARVLAIGVSKSFGGGIPGFGR
jgi:hypothetical protein